jgi:hypothetical protein
MSTPTQQSVPDVPANGPLPPLETGDRLSRAEFERRYEQQGWAGPGHVAFVARLQTGGGGR